MALLTKSKYLAGLQCPSLLWTRVNDKDSIPEPDLFAKSLFEQGYLVDRLAKSLFSDGAVIESEDFKKNLEDTQKLLLKRKPLFEAGILINNLNCRTDILAPAGAKKWDIIEVKSGTKVKEVNLHDVSFQRHLWELAGLKIRKCFIMLVNNEYVRKGRLEPRKLLKKIDVTDEALSVSEGISERIDEMFKILNSSRPSVKIGAHCKDPYDCPLKEKCWGFLPEYNIFNLCRGGKKCFELFERGVMIVPEIPSDFKLSSNQEIQHWCESNKREHINKDALKKFLSRLKYPLYYLDFETFNSVIPLYDGVKPYSQVPFQFSLHVVSSEGKTKHYSFLSSGSGDPRPKFLRELKKLLGSSGSIISYNEGFEKRILQEASDVFKEYSSWAGEMMARFVDLYAPFKNFYYYSPLQKGSASLKKVLPAVTGKDYSKLEIGDGGLASLEYARVELAEVSESERARVRKALEEYCKLDTLSMSLIVNRLKEICL